MRIALLVVVGLLSGCGPLLADAVAKTGARNEVAAIRDARGHSVEAEGMVIDVRMARATEPQNTGGRRDNAHSPSVDLVTDQGTPVRCFLEGTQSPGEFVAGRRARLLGKLYDMVQEEDGHTRVVLQRCRAD